ncbi:MAG: radical SAM protein [Lachnospiraceae bacterium]|nr:radical SAM protein [Lachnospiraceae bacterium]
MNEYLKNLNRIEFVITMACTGRCKHCSEGEHVCNGEHIDGESAAKAIKDVCENYKIQSLMTFGGEPLLYPEDVCKIHAVAKEVGIPKREMITNGFFSKDEKRIKDVVHKLAQSGLNYIMLSVDAFHQETIPLEPVKYFAKCAKNEGISIRVHPAWLVNESDDNPYNTRTKELLQDFIQDGIEYVNPYEDDPRDIQSISFNPNGDVFNGNIYQNCIMDILNSYSVNQ